MRLFVLFVSALAFAGCKQGIGERCQIDSDCATGLVCSAATERCVDPKMSTVFDAPLPVDAPDDAAVDAATDAATDAMPD